MPDPLARPGGVRALIPHLGTADTYAIPPGHPGIDNRVFVGFVQPLSAPGGRLPRMPLLERLTPKGLPAGQTIRTRSTQVRTRVTTTARKARTTAVAYVNAAKMRR